MKADEYRFWRSRPTHERVAAVSEITENGPKIEGSGPHVFSLRRVLGHFERAPHSKLDRRAYAVVVHAQQRATKDLDILVHADAEKAEAVGPSESLSLLLFIFPGSDTLRALGDFP